MEVVAVPEDAVPLDESALVCALRRGDEEAFRSLVMHHQTGMRRVASLYVPQAAVEEVVQDTWVAVIVGIDRFEQRSSLKTWIYRILLNQARRRGPRERRTIPFSAHRTVSDIGPTVDPERFVHPELGTGYWPAAPSSWHGDPEGRLLGSEIRNTVLAAIGRLPPAQREVMTLRDIEHWEASEVCELLRLSAVNQRVLLHRARAAIRRELEVHLDGH